MSDEPKTPQPPPEKPAKAPPPEPIKIIIIEKGTPKPPPDSNPDKGLRTEDRGN